MGTYSERGVAVFFDPGQNTGWARFDNYKLIACGIVHPEHFVDLAIITGIGRIDPNVRDVTVLIEGQEVYRQSRQKSDPNDLIVLAHRAGAIGMAIKLFYHLMYDFALECKFVDPSFWKGSRSKIICHGHMLPNLSNDERTLLDQVLNAIGDKSQHLDIKDAVCLGLWALRRAR